LADAHVEFYGKGIEVWEKYVQEIHMPDDGIQVPIYREDGSTFYS